MSWPHSHSRSSKRSTRSPSSPTTPMLAQRQAGVDHSTAPRSPRSRWALAGHGERLVGELGEGVVVAPPPGQGRAQPRRRRPRPSARPGPGPARSPLEAQGVEVMGPAAHDVAGTRSARPARGPGRCAGASRGSWVWRLLAPSPRAPPRATGSRPAGAGGTGVRSALTSDAGQTVSNTSPPERLLGPPSVTSRSRVCRTSPVAHLQGGPGLGEPRPTPRALGGWRPTTFAAHRRAAGGKQPARQRRSSRRDWIHTYDLAVVLVTRQPALAAEGPLPPAVLAAAPPHGRGTIRVPPRCCRGVHGRGRHPRGRRDPP